MIVGRGTDTGRDRMQLVGLWTVTVTGWYYVEKEGGSATCAAALGCAMNGMTRKDGEKMTTREMRELVE